MQVKKDEAMKQHHRNHLFLVHANLPFAGKNQQICGDMCNKYMDPWVRMCIYIYIHIYCFYIYTYCVFICIYIHGISWLLLLVDVTVVDSLGKSYHSMLHFLCCEQGQLS